MGHEGVPIDSEGRSMMPRPQDRGTHKWSGAGHSPMGRPSTFHSPSGPHFPTTTTKLLVLGLLLLLRRRVKSATALHTLARPSYCYCYTSHWHWKCMRGCKPRQSLAHPRVTFAEGTSGSLALLPGHCHWHWHWCCHRLTDATVVFTLHYRVRLLCG